MHAVHCRSLGIMCPSMHHCITSAPCSASAVAWCMLTHAGMDFEHALLWDWGNVSFSAALRHCCSTVLRRGILCMIGWLRPTLRETT